MGPGQSNQNNFTQENMDSATKQKRAIVKYVLLKISVEKD